MIEPLHSKSPLKSATTLQSKSQLGSIPTFAKYNFWFEKPLYKIYPKNTAGHMSPTLKQLDFQINKVQSSSKNHPGETFPPGGNVAPRAVTLLHGGQRCSGVERCPPVVNVYPGWFIELDWSKG